MFDWAKDNGYWKDNAINVYVPYTTVGFSGASNGIVATQVVVHRVNIDSRIMTHEMGHALGLLHTHQGYAVAYDSSPTNDENCEHVTRDSSNPNYNANDKGDQIHDTAAAPDFRQEFCRYSTTSTAAYNACRQNTPNNQFYIDPNTCNYTGTNEDCLGEEFEIFQSDTRNIMSYSRGGCINQLTAGQGFRVRETINASQSELGGVIGTVESLYEPWRSEYYFAGGTPIDYIPPHFQPGFTYHFLPCEGYYPAPSDYSDTSFSYTNSPIYEQSKYSFVVPIHENHSAIVIDQFDDSQPYKCYNNYNRIPTGGKVTRFNDGSFTYNTTETPKDSTGINDPNLINNLEPGLYKIEKNLNGGYIEQEVIQKNNND